MRSKDIPVKKKKQTMFSKIEERKGYIIWKDKNLKSL